MKTNETAAPAVTSQPANLTVRELAQSLMKQPATAKDETRTAESETTTADRETGEETETAEEISNAAEQATTEETETEATAEQTAETEEHATDEATETAEETQAEPTLSEAAAQRLNADLAPLIEELQKAGAKGALQILQKRIPKLVDQRDTERNGRLTAEAQAAQLREELQQARTKGERGEVRGENGFTHPEVAKVVGELNNVDQFLGWCEANPDGGELPDGKGGKVEINGEQTKALRRELDRARTELVARKVQTESEARAEYQQQYRQAHTEALTEYAWLKNANSPEHQEMQAMLRTFPGFKADPTHELALGDYLAGKAARLAKAKAKAAVPMTRRPAPEREPTRVVADPPTTGARRADPKKEAKKQADDAFQKSGSVRDLAKSFSASRRASRGG